MPRALTLVLVTLLPGTVPPHIPLGQLALHVAMKSEAGELSPIQGGEFALTCEGPGAFSSQVCTDGSGRAFAYAPPGKCRLGTSSPVRVGEKQYTWEGNLEFYPGKETGLELSDDNAQVVEATAPLPADSIAGPTRACGGEPMLPTAEVVLPVLVEKVSAEYPPEAKAKRLQGKVICQAAVGTDGFVRDIKVLSSSNPIFNAPAVRALAKWRYIPAQMGGRAVAVYYTVRTDFKAR
jgi:TonB family protein